MNLYFTCFEFQNRFKRILNKNIFFFYSFLLLLSFKKFKKFIMKNFHLTIESLRPKCSTMYIGRETLVIRLRLYTDKCKNLPLKATKHKLEKLSQ